MIAPTNMHAGRSEEPERLPFTALVQMVAEAFPAATAQRFGFSPLTGLAALYSGAVAQGLTPLMLVLEHAEIGAAPFQLERYRAVAAANLAKCPGYREWLSAEIERQRQDPEVRPKLEGKNAQDFLPIGRESDIAQLTDVVTRMKAVVDDAKDKLSDPNIRAEVSANIRALIVELGAVLLGDKTA